MAITPFKVEVAKHILEDLRERLDHPRRPDEIAGSGWDYGSNLDYIKELVEYWRTTFDWRSQERLINCFPHFKTNIEGLEVHFIHERGKGPNPMPLVITHGWPGPFFEMHKIIPLLTDPSSYGGDAKDSFDVVVPSMPGYGFSDKTVGPGMDVSAVAGMWARLMVDDLGYQRFAAQGVTGEERLPASWLSHTPKTSSGFIQHLVTLDSLLTWDLAREGCLKQKKNISNSGMIGVRPKADTDISRVPNPKLFPMA
jgi:hypothetical protein|tara:strand:+ start:183 stop:944 length:762 start_codon:yes stop_codon:yes gene_type:complete